MSNKWNRPGHWGMGFLAAIVPGLHVRWVDREIEQAPYENDKNPAVLVMFYQSVLGRWVPGDVQKLRDKDGPFDVTPGDLDGGSKVYYAHARVMDSQNDHREIAQGAEVGRFVVLGLGILIGWLIA